MYYPVMQDISFIKLHWELLSKLLPWLQLPLVSTGPVTDPYQWDCVHTYAAISRTSQELPVINTIIHCNHNQVVATKEDIQTLNEATLI